jgi:hypothetical protein
MSKAGGFAGLAMAILAFGTAPAVGYDFIARPTTPLECWSPAAQRLGSAAWFGQFSGSRESETGMLGSQHSEQTFERLCFASERDCRNWLYNMQSTYRRMVWSAFCKKGLSD